MHKIVKYFNSLVEKTLFKLENKTNIFFKKSSKISNFNRTLILLISILFLYLFYLSIPAVYDKTWLQNSIQDRLFKEFDIKFSTSSDISYRILPAPHFLIKDSKIFKNNDENTTSLSEIKDLKVFIFQSNFFDKEKLKIDKVIIDNANFLLHRDDFKLLNASSNKRFSNKKIEINSSNIFFQDNLNETIAIIKINKAFLFFENTKLLNLFNLKGEVFKIPFIFDLKKQIYSSENKEITFSSKNLNLDIYNLSKKKNNGIINGINIISILNSKIYTKYDIEKNLLIFKSGNSKIKRSNINYDGHLSLNPFDLNLTIDLVDYRISSFFKNNSILTEFFKSKLLFNKNISINSLINISTNSKEEIFNSANINLNILNGKINLDQTKFINKDVGYLEMVNSNLFLQKGKLFLNTDLSINIKNSKNLFSILQTSKKLRKPIKNIFINLNYDFLTNQVEFNRLEIDKVVVSEEILAIMSEFNDSKKHNMNNSRRILNKIFSAYEG